MKKKTRPLKYVDRTHYPQGDDKPTLGTSSMYGIIKYLF